ncbi:histidine phosphatase family protein [Patescibacteria group bacterium]
MKAYFVRHGQTNYNVKKLCNDDPTKDVHLTKLGKQQAKTVADKLKNIKLDLVYVSELPRTRETADIITKDQPMDFIVEPRISDRKTGFDSQPESKFFDSIKPDPFNIKLNDGESFQEEKKRVFSFLEELKGLNAKSILVVSHSEILKIVYGYFHNLSDEEMWEKHIDNAQVLEFDI